MLPRRAALAIALAILFSLLDDLPELSLIHDTHPDQMRKQLLPQNIS